MRLTLSIILDEALILSSRGILKQKDKEISTQSSVVQEKMIFLCIGYFEYFKELYLRPAKEGGASALCAVLI